MTNLRNSINNINMFFFLLRMLFNVDGFKKSISKFKTSELEEFKKKAIEEQNYELASYLSYYLEFKKHKNPIKQ